MKTALTFCVFLLVLAAAKELPAMGRINGLPTTTVALKFRGITGNNFFAIVGDIGHVKVFTEPCVARRRLDLEFRNAPLDLVVEAVASQFHFTLAFDDQTLRVGCALEQ